MLNFIGSGSAFNTKLGNNGAFMKFDRKLFMIDCGSSTFSRLMKKELLKDIDHVYVLMTHTHSDHIGSLGDLILYGYYSMGELMEPSVTVIYPDGLPVFEIMLHMGVTQDTYSIIRLPNNDDFIPLSEFGMFAISAVEVNHAPELKCYGYILVINNNLIYYSSDSNEIPSFVLTRINNGEFKYVYQDTSKADYKGNVHLSLRELDELIVKDLEIRSKIFCMHLDNGFIRDEAYKLGFNVVDNY